MIRNWIFSLGYRIRHVDYIHSYPKVNGLYFNVIQTNISDKGTISKHKPWTPPQLVYYVNIKNKTDCRYEYITDEECSFLLDSLSIYNKQKK